MKPLYDILEAINDSVEAYETCKLGDVHTQSEIARNLSVNLKYLADAKVCFHEDWIQAFGKSDKKSDTKRAIDADTECPELYKIRQVQRATENLLNVVRSTISANKQ